MPDMWLREKRGTVHEERYFTKVTFVVLIVIFIFFVMFGKEFMAVINGLIETESLMDQLLR